MHKGERWRDRYARDKRDAANREGEKKSKGRKTWRRTLMFEQHSFIGCCISEALARGGDRRLSAAPRRLEGARKPTRDARVPRLHGTLVQRRLINAKKSGSCRLVRQRLITSWARVRCDCSALDVNGFFKEFSWRTRHPDFRALSPLLTLILPVFLSPLHYPFIFSPFSREIIRLSVHCGFLLSFISAARFPCMLNILPRYFHHLFQPAACGDARRHFQQSW